jgi:hypothetical protein
MGVLKAAFSPLMTAIRPGSDMIDHPPKKEEKK